MAKIVYSRVGDKLVKKYRCTKGRRKGRVVSTIQQCNAPFDIKKRQRMRKLQKQKGNVMALRRERTKRVNPISKQVARLNKIIAGD